MNVPNIRPKAPDEAPVLDGRTAIVGAMAEELAPLASRGRIQRKLNLGACRVQVGTLGNAEVVLGCTGEGRLLAEQGLRALLDAFPVRRVIVVGVAGGLSPRLAPGTVIVAREIRSDGGAPPPPDGPLRECASRFPAALEGTVVTLQTILCTAESKAAAWEDIGRSAPAVVDLESAVYAGVAAEVGVPYLVLRAVCDPAEESLPVDLNECRDELGRVNRVEVFQRAMLSPSIVRSLLDLRGRVAVSANNVANLVDALLNRRIR